MIKLHTANSSTEAHLIRTHLEANGIKAIVQGDALQMSTGDMGIDFGAMPSVHVTDEDAPMAFVILEELLPKLQGQTDPLQDIEWQCDQCGEMNDGHFDICWNCQQVCDALTDQAED